MKLGTVTHLTLLNDFSREKRDISLTKNAPIWIKLPPHAEAIAKHLTLIIAAFRSLYTHNICIFIPLQQCRMYYI